MCKRFLILFCVFVLFTLAGCEARETTPVPADTAVSPTDAPPTTAPAAAATIAPVSSPTILIPTTEATAAPAETPTAAETAVSAAATPLPDVAGSEPPLLRFAAYNEMPAITDPALSHPAIAPDLSNVAVPFILSPAQRERLGQDGIVVSPGMEKEFFTVYEKARYANLPVFVTSDSLLHVYHLLFDKVLRTAENQAFIPLLADLNAAMLAQTDAQYQALRGTAWEDAARRAVAFIGVGSKLLDDAVAVPAYAEDLVNAELALIDEAAGIQRSPLFPGLQSGEDYTQYIPRGHYTQSEVLSDYFRAMMWYGRMTFRLRTDDPEVGRAETRSALLLVHALREAEVNGRPALDAWLDLYNPTVFFVGRSDDLTAQQYLSVIDAVYGPDPALETLADEARLDEFIAQADQLPPPRILGIVIQVGDDVTETTKGFRFMGQRFVPDAYIFRQLIYRNVGAPDKPRMLPNGLDVMAALGSQRAYTHLEEMGETDYAGYPEQMEKMRRWVDGLTTAQWTETLYTTWLYTFLPLLDVPDAGYPQFMGSDAWLDKQLNASLGSWAELKHDTILYAKQAYAELGGGGGGPPLPKEAVGYVEPVPVFYARLSALTQMTLEGLDQRGLLGERDRDSLQRLLDLSNAFRVMAEKELRGEQLSDEELHLIRFYGGELEHLVMAAADTEEDDPFAQPIMDEEPQAAVIADVATAPDIDGDGIPSPVVREVGVGRVDEIYVVVPVVEADGNVYLQVAKGGVFSYYEFNWPADDRLTDEAWRAMLDGGEAPPRPVWTAGFFTEETEYAAWQEVIYSFQRSLTFAYWDRSPGYGWTEEAIAIYQPELDTLQEAGQFIGHQWLGASYRSFDRQAEDRAVITVRETWRDWLYEQQADYPSEQDPIVGHRGPYTLDATYTLELIESEDAETAVWQVTDVVYTNEPPAWGPAAERE